MSSWTPTAPRPAPSNTVGFVAWARANLFATKLDTALTLLAFTLVVYVVEAIFGWAIIDASFSGDDRTACLKEVQGACWPLDARGSMLCVFRKLQWNQLPHVQATCKVHPPQ